MSGVLSILTPLVVLKQQVYLFLTLDLLMASVLR